MLIEYVQESVCSLSMCNMVCIFSQSVCKRIDRKSPNKISADEIFLLVQTRCAWSVTLCCIHLYNGVPGTLFWHLKVQM